MIDLENNPQDSHLGVSDSILEIITPAQTSDLFEFKAWPTEAKRITQSFGARAAFYRRFGLPGHEGIDIQASNGSLIFAVADGVVRAVGDDRLPRSQGGHNYGVRIYISHDHGYETVYAHLDKRFVDVGERVIAGQKIGVADSTGNVDGPHLHLTLKHQEAHEGGRYYAGYPYTMVDPTRFIDSLLHGKPLGIDMNESNGTDFDFELLANVGLKFAFVRLNKTEGESLQKNQSYENTVVNLVENRIFFGNEFVLSGSIDPIAQCRFFIEEGRWDSQLPAVLDIEHVNSESQIRDWVEAFQDKMPDVPLVIRTKRDHWNTLVPRASSWSERLYLSIDQESRRIDPNLPYHWHSWHFWQFSKASRWPGYYGKDGLCISRFNGSLEELTRLAFQVQSQQSDGLILDPEHVPQSGFVDSTDGLRLRSAPSLDAPIIRLLDHGAHVKILLKTADEDTASARQWYKINFAGVSGYVAVDYIRLEN